MDKDNNNDKLVTIAIHSYDRAVILQSILEEEGIPAVINGINLIQPAIPGNVRVRINESDVPNALQIIEKLDFTARRDETDESDDNEDNTPLSGKTSRQHEILIPVDFSSYSLQACKFGFRLAHSTNSSVKLFHAFFTPLYPTAVPFSDTFAPPATDANLYRDLKGKMEQEMTQLVAQLREKISQGLIPDVPFSYTLLEGLPEEEIVQYSKRNKPLAIVMGSRGNNAKELDLIGSVTAEVIDSSRTPIFAIPEASEHDDLEKIKEIVFLTNFREREFKAIETLMNFVKNHSVRIHLAHINKEDNMWDEMKLSGLKGKLKEKYPLIDIEYHIIDSSVGLEESIEKFVETNHIDMIALSSSRRNIFARMFNPGIARRMIFHSNTPLFVIKGME